MPDPTFEIDWRPGAVPSGGPVEYRGLTSSPGQRFVPSPVPWEAGWNTFLRNIFPPSRFWVDPSPTGVGGKAGMALGGIPYGIGALLQGITAGAAAGESRGMVPIRPTSVWDRIRDLLASLSFGLGFTPVGAGAKMGAGLVSGLAGVPDFFTTSGPQALGAVGGFGARSLLEAASGGRGGGGFVSPGLETMTPVGPSNPFTIDGFTPAWAGGPSTWNQPAWTWGPTLSSGEPNPAYRFMSPGLMDMVQTP